MTDHRGAGSLRFQEISWMACNRHGAMQVPEEFTLALQMACDVEPQIIVEIGCMSGGTLYAWRQICDEVYAITLPPPNPDYPISHGAIVLKADSHDPNSRAWLERRLDGRHIDVLHIDGDHSYDGVWADWNMYTPLIRPGGLVLVHDIANQRDPGIDVPRFWQEMERDRPTSVIVSKRKPTGFGVVTMEEQ